MTALGALVENWSTLDAARWQALNATVAAGRLSIVANDQATFGTSYPNGVSTVARYDLTGSQIVVELVTRPAIGTTGTSETRLVLSTAAGDWLVFEVDGANLHAGYRGATAPLASWVGDRPYSAVAHRYWRIAENGDGLVSWAVSPDGYDWTELGAWPATFAVTALKVRLEAGYWSDSGGEYGPLTPVVYGAVNPSFAILGDPLTDIVSDDGAPNLAIDVLPDYVPGTFIVDDSLVDGDLLLGWGSGGSSWVNIVCDVTRAAVRRGATRSQGVLTRTEAGSCTLELTDTGRRFDPTSNADAIHPGIAVRLRAWGGSNPQAPEWVEILFTGRISEDLSVSYQQTGPPLVSFTAVDVIGRLARYSGAGRDEPGAGAGDNLLARVGRAVAETGVDPDAVLSYDADASYAATLAPTTLATVWDPINNAVDAELGRVWVTKFDRLAVRSRGSELSGPVRGTLSDWHGEAIEGTVHCCYDDATVRYGTELLANRAIAGRRVTAAPGVTPPPSALVQVDDTVSQARYSGGIPVTIDRRSLELQTDVQLAPWARYVIDHGAAPELRVDSVSLAPQGAPAAWQAVAATDIGDRWAFRLHPEIGDTVSRTLGVIGLEHDITPAGWSITLATADAPTPTEGNPTGWFLLDESEVDSGDLVFPRSPTTEVNPLGGTPF